MRTTQTSSTAEDMAQLDTDARDLLMHDEEAFHLFFEEAKRKGVRLSLGAPPKPLSMANEIKTRPTDRAAATVPTRAVIVTSRKSSEAEHADSSSAEEVLRKLRWSGNDAGTVRNLSALLDRIKELGIENPDSYLSLRDAAQKSGVAERTLRRYIADGQLETEKVKGARGWEHRVYVPALFAVLQQKAGAFERAHSNPLDEIGREVSSLCRVILEQQTLADARTNRLLDEMRNQIRVMDELRNEQREARKEMAILQDQVVKFMTRPPKRSWFEMFFR
jgi:DNA-binding transcriptional MerR regulator